MFPNRSCRKFTLVTLALALLAAPALAFDPCHDPASRYVPIAQRYRSGLRFTIEQCGLPPSTIFGTVHLDSAAVEQAAASAFAIIPQVKAAGFEEIASPADAQRAMLRYMVFPANDARQLRRLVGPADFAKLSALFSGSQVTPALLDRLRPWAAAVMLDFLDNKSGKPVLDDKLQNAASAEGKPLFGLETIDEQLGIFSSLTERQQIAMLHDSIVHYAEMKRINDAMVAAYIAHDAAAITHLEEALFAEGDDPALDNFLRQRLLLDRNRRMEKRLMPRLKDGPLLVAVGVLHLLGDGGVLQLLEKDGWFVTSVK